MATASQRVFIESLPDFVDKEVALRGWVCRMRVLGKTTFVVLKDCSGEVQCVAAPESIRTPFETRRCRRNRRAGAA